MVTHSQVTFSSSGAQSPLGPPIYSKPCLLLVPHSCLCVRAGSPIPMIPSNALSSIPASSSPSKDTTAPPCFLLTDHVPWQSTDRSKPCCCTREQTAQYELHLLKWMNFRNKREKLVFFRVQVQLNQFKHSVRHYLNGPRVTLPAGKSRVAPP